jgi:hypothetical protein
MYGAQWIFALFPATNESAGKIFEISGFQFTVGDLIAFSTFVLSI